MGCGAATEAVGVISEFGSLMILQVWRNLGALPRIHPLRPEFAHEFNRSAISAAGLQTAGC
jgi:hypothetical protein